MLGGRSMESIFDRMLSELQAPWDLESTGWVPSVDLIERDNEVVVRADLPGMSEKDVEVSVQDGVATIRGERKGESEEKGENCYCSERWAGSFSRSLMLPSGVDPEKSSASFQNGVLEIRFSKSKAASGRKIEIKAA
jgi:HSP20 family protein